MEVGVMLEMISEMVKEKLSALEEKIGAMVTMMTAETLRQTLRARLGLLQRPSIDAKGMISVMVKEKFSALEEKIGAMAMMMTEVTLRQTLRARHGLLRQRPSIDAKGMLQLGATRQPSVMMQAMWKLH